MLSQELVWNYFKWFPASILIVAAATKSFQSPELIAGAGFFSAPTVLLPVIFIELCSAMLIVLLPFRGSWKVANSLYSILFLVASYAWLAGISCQCFGEQSLPILSVLLDLVVLIICIAIRPQTGRSPLFKPSSILLAAPLLGLAGVAVASVRMTTVDRSDPLQFLLADELVGKSWPLASRLDQRLEILEKGDWLVIVVRPGCDHCQELLEDHFSKLPPPDRFRSVFFVAGESTWSYFIDCLPIGEASGVLHWTSGAPFVASPAVFRLTDGRVVSAADSQEADAYVLELLR